MCILKNLFTFLKLIKIWLKYSQKISQLVNSQIDAKN